jgi:hypothetical protein
MCDTINGIRYLFVIIQLITFFSTFSVVQSLVFTETTLSMPVKTQSMTKGGLQNTIDPVPPPSTCLTCPNAITSTPKSTVLTDSTDLLLELPELSKRSTLSLSSSEFDSSTNSSLDEDEFENFKFQNFKLSSGTLLSTHNFQPRAQFVTMESDCQDTKLLGDDEILNMLTAISSRMVAGHQDLQNQLIHNDLKLETELQRVREENAQLRQDLRQEFGSVLSNGITSSSPQVLPDVTLSSPPVPSPSSTQPATSPSQDFQTQDVICTQ